MIDILTQPLRWSCYALLAGAVRRVKLGKPILFRHLRRACAESVNVAQSTMLDADATMGAAVRRRTMRRWQGASGREPDELPKCGRARGNEPVGPVRGWKLPLTPRAGAATRGSPVSPAGAGQRPNALIGREVRLDLWYPSNGNIWLDLKILGSRAQAHRSWHSAEAKRPAPFRRQ